MYEFEELSFWMSLGGWFIPVVVFCGMLYQMSSREEVLDSNFALHAVAGYLTILMAISGWGGDKEAYLALFRELQTGGSLATSKDVAFALITKIIGSLTAWSPLVWFSVIAAGYLGGLVFFIRTISPKAFPIFLSFIISLGFFSYGVNTLRAGFSLSLLMVAAAIYIRKKNIILLVLIALFSVGCHFSMIIPIAAILLGHYIRRPKLFFGGWLVCLALSLAFGEIFQVYLGGYFEGAEDARITNYTLGEGGSYRTGFRWDFLLYSFVGICVAFFYKFFYKVKDSLYDMLLCAYLAANGFWLLLIRIPFTDRVAYLSWFLLPLLLMLPLLRWREIPGRGGKVALTLFFQLFFWCFMAIYRGA